jgi:hypothetical protein
MTIAAMLLLWPLLTGRILFGGAESDMYIAGYSFRLFAAEWFTEHGSIPQWNPYLFGGLPYIGAMHGDIFYPSAWLRWIIPVDLAITWAMAVHFVLAGWFMYRLCRALGLSWGAAIVAGVSYELTGIVASQMSPGHDGKLFVSALTPLSFWVLLSAIRNRRTWAYGIFALVVALMVLGHYHMAYFLLLALGLWTLYLIFWDAERPDDLRPWKALALVSLCVGVGLGITALQVLPFFEYIPYSPRAAGGPNTGWEFATTFAFPPAEVFALLLPELNGFKDGYAGANGLKLHTEYMGFLPLALAGLALGDAARRRLVIACSVGAVLFLLFAFAGHTPFYRPFFELLPLVKKIRAMGMVFFLTAFFLCVLAGIGVDRVLQRAVSMRSVYAIVGGAALFALLGALGGLQPVAESLAIPQLYERALENGAALRAGALRLLVVVALGAGVLWSVASGRLQAGLAAMALAAVVAVDLWSVDRRFYAFSPRAAELFADDAVTTHLRRAQKPYRVFDADAYGYSILMAYGIPIATGYHGFELQRYRELGGHANGWRNLLSPNLLDLLAIRFLVLSEPQEVPRYREVVPRTTTASGRTAVLYERDSIPAYARVIPAAAKVEEADVVATLIDPRLPINGVVLLPDTSSANTPLARPPFAASSASATVKSWEPGAMTITVNGATGSAAHLLISENWYPDWRAEVDGKPGTVRRADHALLSVDLPPSAREVRLWFDSPAYARGKVVSLVSLVLAALLIGIPVFTRRREGKPA